MTATKRSARGCEECGRKIGRRLRSPKDLDADGMLVCGSCRGFTSVGVGLGEAIHVGIVGAMKAACGAKSRDPDMTGDNARAFPARLGTLPPAGSVTCRACKRSHIGKITAGRAQEAQDSAHRAGSPAEVARRFIDKYERRQA